MATDLMTLEPMPTHAQPLFLGAVELAGCAARKHTLSSRFLHSKLIWDRLAHHQPKALHGSGTLPCMNVRRLTALALLELLVTGACGVGHRAASTLLGRPLADVGDPPEHLHAWLHEADQKLLGSDSGRLDVGGAVGLLRAVHTEVARRLGTAVNASPPDGDADAQQEQQHQEQHQEEQEHARPGAARGRRQMQQQTRRTARAKKAKSAALWRDLGRASYMLAALSASGLISEYLPPPQLPAPAATAALCRQLQAVVGSAPSTDSFSAHGARRRLFGSDSSQQPPCKVASSDPVILQELEWLVTAATAGTAEAQMALADRFLMGRGGLGVSCENGLAWLQQAAAAVMRTAEAAGDWDMTPSFIRLRERFIDMSSPQSYREWDEVQMGEELTAAAAFGSADSYAQRRLGYRMLMGRGVPVDYRAAYENFVSAADGATDGYALYNLGYMYLKGWYVARDPHQALQYFKRALERGVGAAANAIGVLAAHGEGMPADMNAAARWFEKGANMSDPDSIYNLGTLYLHGRGVPHDALQALSYYGMAFDLGHWKAAYALGQLYAGDEPELGHNCEYAEKYLWQFVSQRSSWLSSAQAALLDYDSPSSAFAARPTEASSSHRHTDTDTHDASTPAMQDHSAGQPDSSSAQVPAAVLASTGAAAQVPDRYLQALVRYLLLAESGCEAAAENAAWMLLHAQGASGPRAVGLAAHLLYRSSLLNHTSSMVELATLLLNESIVTHQDQLQQAVALSGLTLPQDDAAAAAPAAGGSNVSLGLLHHVLLQQPNAFMPPVAGLTACTGFYRREVPQVVHNVSSIRTAAPTARSTPPGRLAQGSAADSAPGVAGGADVSGVLVLRARRAAVAWLSEASSVGDAEAAALLGWLWHEGVLQGSRAQQEALAVIGGALAVQSQPGQKHALQLAQAAIWLEQQANRLLGFRPVAAFRALLVAARDAAVRLHGTHPPVLDMPDGFTTAAALPRGRVGAVHRSLRWGAWAQLRRGWLGLQHAVELAVWGPAHAAAHEGGKGGEARGGGQQQVARGGLWEAVGAEKVDRENLVLTMLMCALAGVLWLHVRQQGQRPARGVAAAPARQVPVPMQQQQQQQQQAAARTVPAVGGEAGDPRGESSRQQQGQEQQEEEREEAPGAAGTSRERSGQQEQASAPATVGSSEGAGTSGRSGQQEQEQRAESVVGEVTGTLDENRERVRASSLSI